MSSRVYCLSVRCSTPVIKGRRIRYSVSSFNPRRCRGLLLDAAADLIERGRPELGDVERV